MTDLYILASMPGQGKTTTSVLLSKYLEKEGKKTACLQTEKGLFDVYTYLEAGRYHYSIPLEAAKSRESFEKWLPTGYDAYILEITFPYSPIGAAFIDLFENVNEVVSYELKERWENYLHQKASEYWGPLSDSKAYFSDFLKSFNDRNVARVHTKTKGRIDGPFVDNNFNLGNPDDFVCDRVSPRYTCSKSEKKAIAVGAFPAEYWDIYPDLKWYGFDYASFMERFRKKNFDLAVIGACMNQDLKIRDRPAGPEIICYQPSLYYEMKKINLGHGGIEDFRKNMDDFMEVYRRIKNEPVGTSIGKEGGIFAGFNNKYWTFRTHPDFDIMKKEENILFCNGWILPQYLIRDGFLEVE
jgi:hypothetical protein